MSANSAPAAETEAGKPSGSGFRLPSIPFWVQIVAGLVLGVLLGWITRSYEIAWLYTTLDKVGHLFVQLLKLAVAPLVFFAILVSITNLRKVNNAARLATRTLLWFMITSLIAVAIGLAIGLITNLAPAPASPRRTAPSPSTRAPGSTSSPASSRRTSSRRSPS